MVLTFHKGEAEQKGASALFGQVKSKESRDGGMLLYKRNFLVKMQVFGRNRKNEPLPYSGPVKKLNNVFEDVRLLESEGKLMTKKYLTGQMVQNILSEMKYWHKYQVYQLQQKYSEEKDVLTMDEKELLDFLTFDRLQEIIDKITLFQKSKDPDLQKFLGHYEKLIDHFKRSYEKADIAMKRNPERKYFITQKGLVKLPMSEIKANRGPYRNAQSRTRVDPSIYDDRLMASRTLMNRYNQLARMKEKQEDATKTEEDDNYVHRNIDEIFGGEEALDEDSEESEQDQLDIQRKINQNVFGTKRRNEEEKEYFDDGEEDEEAEERERRTRRVKTRSMNKEEKRMMGQGSFGSQTEDNGALNNEEIFFDCADEKA